MPFLDRDGASIHYEAIGDGGLRCCVTHGFSSSGDAFASERWRHRRLRLPGR